MRPLLALMLLPFLLVCGVSTDRPHSALRELRAGAPRLTLTKTVWPAPFSSSGAPAIGGPGRVPSGALLAAGAADAAFPLRGAAARVDPAVGDSIVRPARLAAADMRPPGLMRSRWWVAAAATNGSVELDRAGAARQQQLPGAAAAAPGGGPRMLPPMLPSSSSTRSAARSGCVGVVVGRKEGPLPPPLLSTVFSTQGQGF